MTSRVHEDPQSYLQDPYRYKLIQTPTGYQYLDPQTNELSSITDVPAGTVMFTFKDIIKVDSSWLQNIPSPIETSFGNLLVNAIALSDVFGKKIPYMTGKISVKRVEEIVAPILKDTPTDDQRNYAYIYVDEYTKFIDRLQYIASLSSLCVWSATRRNITGPTGLKAYREQLLKEYGDRLKDPATLAEFEKKLRDYDNEYLKDDPSNGIFLSGKTKDIARKKMYLTTGAGSSFSPSNTVTPTIQSLEEGWSTDPQEFTASMNDLRYGSYARGAETVKGGVTAKSLLRSLGSYVITMDDCGSSFTLAREFTQDDYDRLISRYIVESGKLLLIDSDDMARKYIGRTVNMRSPLYCKSKGESFCKYCTGEKLAANPNGLSLAVTDVSSVILYAFMKLMHGSTLSSVHFDFKQGLT